MRKQLLKGQRLDILSAAPHVDAAEFKAAFARVKALYPTESADTNSFGYIGYRCGEHYFQKRSDPVSYVVPASEGWAPKFNLSK